ncbi:MAG: protein O-mannosyl-transferase family, partial [Candidatus Thorarchaeota archaeon]
DSGELALCASSFGVPHPTGYPLYLILTVPAALFFSRPITAVTIFCGIIAAGAGAGVYYLLRHVRDLCLPRKKSTTIVLPAFTVLLFLSPVVAEQGMTNEVYGLGMLTGVLVLVAVMASLTADDRMQSERYLVGAWYLWGLSMCNHMSAVQFVPALVIVTGYHWMRRNSRSAAAFIIPAVVVPLTMYAVLPIRAGAEPPPITNWGGVDDWGNLIRHVSGWQFKIWLFSGDFGEIWLNLKRLASLLYAQYPWPVLVLSLPGIIAAWRRARLLFGILMTTMAVNIILGINYSIPDIESYYLQTIVTFAIFAVIGLLWIGSLLRRRSVIVGIAAALLTWQAAVIWQSNSKGDYTLPEDYAYNICRSAPPGAVILSELWDHHGQAFYLQQAELVRPDIYFIDKELLRRSWYYDMIHHMYPVLYSQIATLAAEFTAEVRRFESGKTFDPQKLEYYYQLIINTLLTRCGQGYIDYQLRYQPIGDHYLRPRGILFQVDTLPVSAPLTEPTLIWRGRDFEDYDDWRAEDHIEMVHEMTRPR